MAGRMAATNKTLLVLAYATLEWILILMILLNSVFSYLIRKFATYYALKPPCICCSNIDHLFEPNKNINRYQNLICEAHLVEFLNIYYCPDRHKVAYEPRCSYCSLNVPAICADPSLSSALKIESNYKEIEIVEMLDIPVENKSGHIQVFDQIIPLEWTDSSTSCSRSSSINGDDQVEKLGCQDEEEKEDKVVTIDSLKAELKSERLVVCGLSIELEEERNASSIAASQAMAMITKLQEEKVALQIESFQNQRMVDEQAEYDQEVLQLLNELVMKLENDKIELENELEMYKDKFLDYKGKNKAKMVPRCIGDSYSISKESVHDISISGLKNLRTLEDSIDDFEVQRLWILDEILRKDVDEDQVAKASLDGENFGYKGNRLLRVFDIEGIDDEAEASHSAWSLSSF